jgi:hypothetical protein
MSILKSLSRPVLIVNNVSVPYVAGTLTFTEGTPEKKVRTQTGGGGSVNISAIATANVPSGWPVVANTISASTSVDPASWTGAIGDISDNLTFTDLSFSTVRVKTKSNGRVLIAALQDSTGTTVLLGGQTNAENNFTHGTAFSVPNSGIFSAPAIIDIPSSDSLFIVAYKHSSNYYYWGIVNVTNTGTVTMLNTGVITPAFNLSNWNGAISFDGSVVYFTYVNNAQVYAIAFSVDLSGTPSLTSLASIQVSNEGNVLTTFITPSNAADGLFDVGYYSFGTSNSYIRTITRNSGSGSVERSQALELTGEITNLISVENASGTESNADCVVVYGQSIAKVVSGTPAGTPGAAPTIENNSQMSYSDTLSLLTVIYDPLNKNKLIGTVNISDRISPIQFSIEPWGFWSGDFKAITVKYQLKNPNTSFRNHVIPVIVPLATELYSYIIFFVDINAVKSLLLIEGYPFTTNIDQYYIGWSKSSASTGEMVDIAVVGDVVTVNANLLVNNPPRFANINLDYNAQIVSTTGTYDNIGRMISNTDLVVGWLNTKISSGGTGT